MEGSDRTCEDNEDTTTVVQIEEAKCAILKMSYVAKLSPVRAVNGMGTGCQASLSCSRCQENGICPKKQEPAVRLSRVNTTELVCLQELLKRQEDRHGECAQVVAKDEKATPDTPKKPKPNVMQVMMMLQQTQHPKPNHTVFSNIPSDRKFVMNYQKNPY